MIFTPGYFFLYCASRLKWPLYGRDGSIAAAGMFGQVMPVSGLFAPLPICTLLSAPTLAKA
jgi:hypothetical protein